MLINFLPRSFDQQKANICKKEFRREKNLEYLQILKCFGGAYIDRNERCVYIVQSVNTE